MGRFFLGENTILSTKFVSHLDEVLAAVDSRVEAALEECGMDAEYYAVKKCPVDTGRLRDSIAHETKTYNGGGDMIVGTNVEYAQYVEYGTTRQKAQPYLKPAIADHKEHYKAVIEKHLKGGKIDM